MGQALGLVGGNHADPPPPVPFGLAIDHPANQLGQEQAQVARGVNHADPLQLPAHLPPAPVQQQLPPQHPHIQQQLLQPQQQQLQPQQQQLQPQQQQLQPHQDHMNPQQQQLQPQQQQLQPQQQQLQPQQQQLQPQQHQQQQLQPQQQQLQPQHQPLLPQQQQLQPQQQQLQPQQQQLQPQQQQLQPIHQQLQPQQQPWQPQQQQLQPHQQQLQWQQLQPQQQQFPPQQQQYVQPQMQAQAAQPQPNFGNQIQPLAQPQQQQWAPPQQPFNQQAPGQQQQPLLIQGPPNRPDLHPTAGRMTSFNSAPLDAMLDDRTREKIVSNKFVDFHSLIRREANESVVVTQLGEDGQAQTQSLLLAGQRQRHQLTYSQWQKAFYIFATAYARVHPQEFPNLLKYADTIRELFNSRARWEFYDERFRRTRELAGWRWDEIQMELWGKAMALFRDVEDNDRQAPTHRPQSSSNSRFQTTSTFKPHQGGGGKPVNRSQRTYPNRQQPASGPSHNPGGK